MNQRETPLVVLCTAPADGETSTHLARGLVENRLAACVNVLPGVRSFYRWKGEICNDQEVQLLIKTRREKYPELEAWLREHHPYDEPEIIALSIEQGSASYLAWLTDQTR